MDTAFIAFAAFARTGLKRVLICLIPALAAGLAAGCQTRPVTVAMPVNEASFAELGETRSLATIRLADGYEEQMRVIADLDGALCGLTGCVRKQDIVAIDRHGMRTDASRTALDIVSAPVTVPLAAGVFGLIALSSDQPAPSAAGQGAAPDPSRLWLDQDRNPVWPFAGWFEDDRLVAGGRSCMPDGYTPAGPVRTDADARLWVWENRESLPAHCLLGTVGLWPALERDQQADLAALANIRFWAEGAGCRNMAYSRSSHDGFAPGMILVASAGSRPEDIQAYLDAFERRFADPAAWDHAPPLDHICRNAGGLATGEQRVARLAEMHRIDPFYRGPGIVFYGDQVREGAVSKRSRNEHVEEMAQIISELAGADRGSEPHEQPAELPGRFEG